MASDEETHKQLHEYIKDSWKPYMDILGYFNDLTKNLENNEGETLNDKHARWIEHLLNIKHSYNNELEAANKFKGKHGEIPKDVCIKNAIDYDNIKEEVKDLYSTFKILKNYFVDLINKKTTPPQPPKEDHPLYEVNEAAGHIQNVLENLAKALGLDIHNLGLETNKGLDDTSEIHYLLVREFLSVYYLTYFKLTENC